MEIEISELSTEPSTKIDEHRIHSCETSNEFFTENHVILDVLGGDDQLLLQFSENSNSCSSETSATAENIWDLGVVSDEIIAGLQKVSTDDQDCARRDAWTIYKVHQNLKSAHQEDTFHPMVVSIGPFHHNKAHHLKPMEQHKWRFLLGYLKSMKFDHHDYGDQTRHSSTPGVDDAASHAIVMTNKIHYLVVYMKMLEAKARACYSETFDDLDSNEFVQMMVLDGCFIIQLLLLFQNSRLKCMTAESLKQYNTVVAWTNRRE